MNIQLRHTFENVTSLENFLGAWEEFVCGKSEKSDVQDFARNLMANISVLQSALANRSYRHGGYYSFFISDPKPRHIHKASVRDRLLHHAIYRVLYPFFDRTFIADSFSCRVGKGTHAAGERFRRMAYQVSQNNTRTCWVLKCDIQQFFASIDQHILLLILKKYIIDPEMYWLLETVVRSFSSSRAGIGLPLGNLTSQLFTNVYMNVFDQFVKHRLHVRKYIRYADDFVLLSHDRSWLLQQLSVIDLFLREQIHLSLHPKKIHLQTLASGVDFLGWVYFPHHTVLRTRTKKRMLRRIAERSTDATLQSYLGLLSHGSTLKLQTAVQNTYWLHKMK